MPPLAAPPLAAPPLDEPPVLDEFFSFSPPQFKRPKNSGKANTAIATFFTNYLHALEAEALSAAVYRRTVPPSRRNRLIFSGEDEEFSGEDEELAERPASSGADAAFVALSVAEVGEARCWGPQR